MNPRSWLLLSALLPACSKGGEVPRPDLAGAQPTGSGAGGAQPATTDTAAVPRPTASDTASGAQPQPSDTAATPPPTATGTPAKPQPIGVPPLSIGRPTGGGCPQDLCVEPPGRAPSAPAPGFPMCPAQMQVPLTSAPNPRPFKPALASERRKQGEQAFCCYDAPRLCGGGRPLRVGGAERRAALARGAWG